MIDNIPDQADQLEYQRMLEDPLEWPERQRKRNKIREEDDYGED